MNAAASARRSPVLPFDPREAEFARPKTIPEWLAFYAEEVPLREQIAQFARYQIYWSASDLCYVDNGLMDPPDRETRAALEYTADHLQDDPALIAALWALRHEMREKSDRWEVQVRAIAALRKSVTK